MNVLSLTQRRISAKMFAGIIMVSLLLSAFPAAFFVAEAATQTPLSGESFTIDVDNSVYTNIVDTTGLTNIELSFNYDLSLLDGDDSGVVITYSAGSELGTETVNGTKGDATVSGDTALITLTGLSAEVALAISISADVAGFSGAATDSIELTNITVSGEDVIIEPSVTSNGFYTRGTKYKTDFSYFATDFAVNDFKSVSDVKLDIYRSGDTTPFTTVNGKADLNTYLNSQLVTSDSVSISSPVPVSPMLTNSQLSDLSGAWIFPDVTWTPSDVPEKVIITVAGLDKDDKDVEKNVEITNFANDPEFSTLFPEKDKEQEVIVVTGDTSAGENQPGWLFNRDVGNATPIDFNEDEKVIGDGALYVLPISNSDAPRKFIGEYFWLGDIADLDGFSYDFKIGAGGVGSDSEEFYLNVYANFAASSPSKYYDCKYDVVPSNGTTGSFETVTFDPTQSYPVTTRSGGSASPHTCPAVPADMDNEGVGSKIRAFALNTGDTSLSDADLDGYFDNVVLDTKAKVTTFDFDPDGSAPISFTSTNNGDGTASATTTSDTIKTITSSQGDVKMTIPSGTVITSEGWNGTLIAPTVVSITTAPVAEDGFENPTEIITIQVGTSDGTKVTFDKAVQLEFEGQSGNSVGWSRGGTFTPITTTCSDNTQAVGNALAAEGDCKISVGGDLFVWTKHFTDFTVYTQTATPAPATTSSGGSSSGTRIRDIVEPTPLVLGVTDSLLPTDEELTGVLTSVSGILAGIQSGYEAGDISDEDATKLVAQLSEILTILLGLYQ